MAKYDGIERRSGPALLSRMATRWGPIVAFALMLAGAITVYFGRDYVSKAEAKEDSAAALKHEDEREVALRSEIKTLLDANTREHDQILLLLRSIDRRVR
jgi:hypothetical protein